MRRRGSDHIDLVETQFIDTSVSPASEPEIDPVALVLEIGGTSLVPPGIEVLSASGGESSLPIIEVISEGPLPSFNPPLTRASDPVVLQFGGLNPFLDSFPLFDYI